MNQVKNLLKNCNVKKKDKIKIDRGIRRQVDIDLGITPPKTKVHKNKKKYSRKDKHKNKKLQKEYKKKQDKLEIKGGK